MFQVLQGVLDRDSPITAQVEGRIILVCLFCRLFCLLLKHDLIDSAIGTAVDFVAGFLGSLCSVSLEYFVVKAVSYMKMYMMMMVIL